MVVSKQQAPIVSFQDKTNRSMTKASNRLADFKASEQWNQLTRRGQISFEHRAHQLDALLNAEDQHGLAVSESRGQHVKAIATAMKEWQAQIDQLGDLISDDERKALIIAKSNELASLLAAHQTTLDALDQAHGEQAHDIMTRTAYEWIKPTLTDQIDNALSLGEAEIERRGLPPLSFWQSVGNTVTLGMVADKYLRDAERERLMPQSSTPAGEEVIDATYQVK